MNDELKSALEAVCTAYGCTMEEAMQLVQEMQAKLEMEKLYAEKCFDYLERCYVDDWELERRRELAEFGRSRLAQFGKTHTVRQYVKARPYWFRTRSFCVRSPYG